MPTSRFLKKRRQVTVEDAGPGVLSSLEGNRVTTNQETRHLIGAERSLYDSSQKQWKSKDEDFAKSIKKRLSDLTNSLLPSSSLSSSSSFAVSSSSPSRFRSRTPTGLSQHQHLSIRDSVVATPRYPISSRETYVPSVHQERRPLTANSLDRWRGESHRRAASGADREVRSFLLDRKFSKAPCPEDDESHLVRSMWDIVRSLGSGGGGGGGSLSAEYYWHPTGHGGTRRELAEFSRGIGSLLSSSSSADTEYRLDGRSFWSRLAACRGEFLRTEHLVSSIFDRGQGFGGYHFVYPYRRETVWTSLPVVSSSLSDSPRIFSPADEAISWARHHRLKALYY